MNSPASREEEIFTAAVALASAERAAWLDRACAGDASLRRAVEALLQAHAGASGFLEGRAGFCAVMPDPERGATVGRYRLRERLGEGGCGVVFLADQTEPVQREVALKIVKPGLDTRAVIARFEAERQALARMDHAGIAQIFDAGTTETGRPYFVMEFVRGVRITDYCDQHNLSTAARLKLFARVCHAIQHAHQKGIIHRDLKPSNILVTGQGEAAAPKVIDFGIAKATQGRLTDETIHTQFDQLLGTPAYMSPEQAAAAGSDVDTRSDIYSLGVLLYELLTGRPPFDPRVLRESGLEEIRRIIREVDPPTPSTRIGTLADADRAAVARQRQTAPPQLSTLLRGDLDWIAMKALEKDRARRYATAASLADDVERHLRDEAVLARPPSRLYLARKLVRRHRALFAAVGAIAIVLLVATLFSAWQAVRAREAEQFARDRLHAEQLARAEADQQRTVAAQERDRAQAAEKNAQAEAAISKAVNEFLQVDLLRQAGPNQQPDRDIKLRTVLDRAAARVEGRFANQPLVEASIRETLARTYLSLGEAAIAQRHLERAVELSRRAAGESDPRTLGATANLMNTLSAQGRYREAETIGVKLLPELERVRGPEHRATLATMGNLASVQGRLGKYAEAEALSRRLIERDRRVLGPEDPATLAASNSLANIYRQEGRLDDAGQLFREGLEVRRRVLGPKHPDTLGAIFNVANVTADQRDFATAEKLFREALEQQRAILGPEHPDTLASLGGLASVLTRAGRREEALPLQREALDHLRKTVGPDHPTTLSTMHNLALTCRDLGNLDEAESLFAQVQSAASRVLGQQHPNTIMNADSLARLYLSRGKIAAAEPLVLSHFEAARQHPPPAGNAALPRLRDLIASLQHAYAEAGDGERAQAWQQRLNEIAAR